MKFFEALFSMIAVIFLASIGVAVYIFTNIFTVAMAVLGLSAVIIFAICAGAFELVTGLFKKRPNDAES